MTAVEWLCNEWLYLDQQFDMCLIDRNIYWDKLRQIQEQAKEMEKEQIEKLWTNEEVFDMLYKTDKFLMIELREYWKTIEK
jgi:hypothetical protein